MIEPYHIRQRIMSDEIATGQYNGLCPMLDAYINVAIESSPDDVYRSDLSPETVAMMHARVEAAKTANAWEMIAEIAADVSAIDRIARELWLAAGQVILLGSDGQAWSYPKK